MMSDLDSRLGLPLDNDDAYDIAVALIHEQIRELEKPGYHDPPPDESMLPNARSGALQHVNAESVKQLRSALQGTVEEHPVPSLLIAAHNEGDELDERLVHIVAKTVHLSLLLTDMGEEYNEEIVQACRRARLLLKRDRKLLPLVPSFKRAFSTIAESLQSLYDNPPEGEDIHGLQLEYWIRSFTTYLDNRQKYTRHAFGSDTGITGESVEHPVLDEDDAALSVAEAPCTVPFPNSPEEARDDQPKAGKAVRPLIKSTSSDRSRGMAWSRGKEMMNRLFMEFSLAPCLGSRLTDFQVRRSFEICYRRVSKSPAHLLTALLILTGRRADRLNALELRKQSNADGPGEYWLVESGRVFLRYEPKLPDHDKVTKLKGIKKASDNSIRMALPRRISNALLQLYGRNRRLRRPVDIEPAITELSREVDKHISAVRLSNTLTHALNADGVDDVLMAWLTGGSPKHNAGMYYTLVSRADAATAHADFVDALLKHVGVKERLDRTADKTYVGTRIRIDPEFIARSFHRQADELIAALQNSQAVCPYKFHNRFVLYVVQLLGLVTLIRSVTEPFGKQDDSNLLARTVRIADKVNRLGVNGRLVSLGDTATEQLENYNRHLEGLYDDLRHHEPETASLIQAALDGSDSYLFYFDADRRIQPLRPKWILEELRTVWPFPTNWPRHSLSAWIRQQEFSKGAIRAQYGHSDFGPAPLSRFDGTAVLELSSIASVIDDYLSRHDIRSIQGWNTRI